MKKNTDIDISQLAPSLRQDKYYIGVVRDLKVKWEEAHGPIWLNGSLRPDYIEYLKIVDSEAEKVLQSSQSVKLFQAYQNRDIAKSQSLEELPQYRDFLIKEIDKRVSSLVPQGTKELNLEEYSQFEKEAVNDIDDINKDFFDAHPDIQQKLIPAIEESPTEDLIYSSKPNISRFVQADLDYYPISVGTDEINNESSLTDQISVDSDIISQSQPTERVSRSYREPSSNILSQLDRQKGSGTPATKAVVKQIANKVGGSLGSALGTALGPVGTKIGNFIGNTIGKAVGNLLTDPIGTLKRWMGNFAKFATGAAVAIGTSLILLILQLVLWGLIFVSGMVLLTVIILFIINSGAYIVPPGGFGNQNVGGAGGGGGVPPPGGGGILGDCENGDFGVNITEQLAGLINSANVHLLGGSTGSRALQLCIKPTMIVMHWSAGYDNSDGSEATYSTLTSRNLSCQLATDTDNTILMQPFYEKAVEMAWCAGPNANPYSVQNELSGGCTDNPSSGYRCNRTLTECPQPDDVKPGDIYNIQFDDNPPHPCEPINDLGVDAICKVMQQYCIPISQIKGHYHFGKADPGQEYLENYFIPRMQNECEIDLNACGEPVAGVSTSNDVLNNILNSSFTCNSAVSEIDSNTENLIKTSSNPNLQCESISNLRKVTTDYWGFDGVFHSDGELIVSKDHAERIAYTFKSLCELHFPINKIKPLHEYSDNKTVNLFTDNDTFAYSCTDLEGVSNSNRFGISVNINPIQNPLVDNEKVFPTSGISYIDRNNYKMGMLLRDDLFVGLFEKMGWNWGGNNLTKKNYMNFSAQ